MEVSGPIRRWWFENPDAEVPNDVVTRLRADRVSEIALVEAGDTLFALPGASQTWRASVQGGG